MGFLGSFIFFFRKLKSYPPKSVLTVEFKHIGRSANTMADLLAKQMVDRVVPLIAHTQQFAF